MMFRQSLENHYRGELYKLVETQPEFDNIQPLDADKYIALSMLQKAIRRGEFDFAYSAALTLLNNDARAFWRRMCVIVFEDIGIANLDLVGRVTIAAGDKPLREKLGGDRILAAVLISEMCRSAKDRSTDDLMKFIEHAPALNQARDNLAEMNLRDRLACAENSDQPFSYQSTAAWAAAVGLPSDPQSRQDRIACSGAYFESMSGCGYDRTCVEISILGLRRSGVALPVFMPLLYRAKGNETARTQDDHLPPQISIKGIPSWVFNGHTRGGLSSFREYIKQSGRMQDFLGRYANKELSKPKIVAALISRLESVQMTNRLRWPTGDKIRESATSLGWGIPDEAVPLGSQIVREEFDLLNECRLQAAQLYLR